MQTRFKRHQKVRILNPPDSEYVEYKEEPVPIIKGMKGEVNVILPNGQYHVEIFNSNNQVIAYAPFDEDSLEAD